MRNSFHYFRSGFFLCHFCPFHSVIFPFIHFLYFSFSGSAPIIVITKMGEKKRFTFSIFQEFEMKNWSSLIFETSSISFLIILVGIVAADVGLNLNVIVGAVALWTLHLCIGLKIFIKFVPFFSLHFFRVHLKSEQKNSFTIVLGFSCCMNAAKIDSSLSIFLLQSER